MRLWTMRSAGSPIPPPGEPTNVGQAMQAKRIRENETASAAITLAERPQP